MIRAHPNEEASGLKNGSKTSRIGDVGMSRFLNIQLCVLVTRFPQYLNQMSMIKEPHNTNKTETCSRLNRRELNGYKGRENIKSFQMSQNHKNESCGSNSLNWFQIFKMIENLLLRARD